MHQGLASRLCLGYYRGMSDPQDNKTSLRVRRLSFSLRQLLMVVALIAILIKLTLTIREGLPATRHWVTALAFSPDGRTLAATVYSWRRVQIYTPDPKVRSTGIRQTVTLCGLPSGEKSVLLR